MNNEPDHEIKVYEQNNTKVNVGQFGRLQSKKTLRTGVLYKQEISVVKEEDESIESDRPKKDIQVINVMSDQMGINEAKVTVREIT